MAEMELDDFGDLEDIEDEEDVSLDGDAAGGRGLLGTVLFYHPLIFLAASTTLALIAWAMMPAEATGEIKRAEDFYRRGLHALMTARDPLADLTDDEMSRALKIARGDFAFIFGDVDLVRELDQHPDWINPYMLYADSLRLYAKHHELDREQRYAEAVTAYERALEWESRNRDPKDGEAYNRQFYSTAEGSDAVPVMRVHQSRRQAYLDYWRAVSLMHLGQRNKAKSELLALAEGRQLERLDRTRMAEKGEVPPPDPPLLPFELAAEDWTRLNFFLAQLEEEAGNRDAAERYYRLFLQNAPRGPERFQALLRLGHIYYQRGIAHAVRATAATGDTEGERRQAISDLSDAAGQYNDLIEASPPEEILRIAYFQGGKAYLEWARALGLGTPTIWDDLAATGKGLERTLLDFSGGQRLPERTRSAAGALGRILVDGAANAPDPLGQATAGAAGLVLEAGARDRQTRAARVASLLERARLFFDGARSGAGGDYDGPARVMSARSLLVEGRIDEAQRLFSLTLEDYTDREVRLACLLGMAETYLAKGELERARVRFLGGVEKTGTALLRPADVKDWFRLTQRIHEGAQRDDPNPSQRLWSFLSPPARDLIAEVALTARMPDRYQPILLAAINEVLGRDDFYDPKSFAGITLQSQARRLLDRELALLSLNERQWLNRMLLDAAFSGQLVPTDPGDVIQPFPGASELPPPPRPGAFGSRLTGFGLVPAEDVSRALRDLSSAFVRRANGFAQDSLPRQDLRVRRALEDATQVNRFTLAKYNPDRIEVMMDTAELLIQQAELAAGGPVPNRPKAVDLAADAAEAYLEIAKEPGVSELHGEMSLRRAGRAFFAVERYGRAVEAFRQYLEDHGRSERGGEVKNMLGRAYVMLGQLNRARETYADNARRRSPDGRKSLYYLGSTFAAIGEDLDRDGQPFNRLGDPRQPYPQQDKYGVLRIHTALQAFNELQRLEGIAPSSRPWRWAMFDLGRVWFEIAERERLAKALAAETPAEAAAAGAAAEQPREAEEAAATPATPMPSVFSLYEEAANKLRESIKRYPLKPANAPESAPGISARDEPQDYREVIRQRLLNEYYLARALREMGRLDPDGEARPRYEREARAHLERVIDQAVYPERIFHDPVDAPMVIDEMVLGVNEGPTLDADELARARRNAFFILGDSYYQQGAERLDGPVQSPKGAEAAFEQALRVYRLAHDRLSPRATPAIMYLMAECLARMGRMREARRRYELAREAERNLRAEQADLEGALDPKLWRARAEDRLGDLPYESNTP